MNWTGTRPASSYSGSGTAQTGTPVVTLQQMIDALPIVTQDYNYICDLIDAATEFAEEATASSLLNRTITAKYYQIAQPVSATLSNPSVGKLYLPRGPIQSITSIVDANSNITNYQLAGAGTSDWVQLLQNFTAPVTVTFVAGYGTTYTAVPADICIAIRTHVATLWRMRESVSEDRLLPVPHSLEAFYGNKRRRASAA